MGELLYIVALSLGSVIAIFVLTKLMGYRQMSQMSMFDYIIGITIGSIAAEMATSLEEDFMQPLVAMVVYALASVLLAWITSKSMKARRVIEGTPLILLDRGELYLENLRRAKMDVTEFLVQCRVNGYFDVSMVETAILEGNGKISILPKSSNRPVTPQDMELSPDQERMVANVIVDGKILDNNLVQIGKDRQWLHNQIKAHGAGKEEEVLLATCDDKGRITVFLKKNKKPTGKFLM